MANNPQISYSLVAVTGATLANPGDTIIATTGTSTFKVTLPPVASCFSPVTVRKVDAATGTVNVVTADGSTIDGVAGTTGLTTATTNHTGWTFAPNAQASWNVVSA